MIQLYSIRSAPLPPCTHPPPSAFHSIVFPFLFFAFFHIERKKKENFDEMPKEELFFALVVMSHLVPFPIGTKDVPNIL